MPRWIRIVGLLAVSLALVPVACIARARTNRSPLPRVHVIRHMDSQGSYRDQEVNPLFADRREERPHVPGTVARGRLEEDERFFRGMEGGVFTTGIPVRLTMASLRRGQQRFEIYCAPCHGLSGYGDGMVSRRADRLQEGTWVPPTSLHDPTVIGRPDGHLYNTIANGIRNMPSYGSQIGHEDRWLIVAYVRALQRSQRAGLPDVPPELQGRIAAPQAPAGGGTR